MSTRARYRFADHTIRHVPEGGVIYEASCVTCDEKSAVHEEQEAVQDWCLRHTGQTLHDLFRRVVTDHALVTRDE